MWLYRDLGIKKPKAIPPHHKSSQKQILVSYPTKKLSMNTQILEHLSNGLPRAMMLPPN